MNLEQLRENLDRFANSLSKDAKVALEARLSSLTSVYPFSEYEYILMFLLHKEAVTLQQYEALRARYVSANKYLELFELAPRIFGEIWGQQHITDLDPRFTKPDKILNGAYDGQYDLWIEGARVEVKAARAIDTKSRGSLVSKALRYSDSRPFWMNFQQLKPDAADVFVFLGVWVDRIAYWVLSAKEIEEHPSLSHQHRGGVEFQIGIRPNNMGDFDEFRVEPSAVGDTVLAKGKYSALSPHPKDS